MVERFAVTAGNPDLADPSSGVIGLEPIAQPFDNHDGGSGGDPFCHGQDRASLFAKMSRVDRVVQ